MTTLIVGFDSAWTPTNSGAIVGALHCDDGTFRDLDVPQIVDFKEAEGLISQWQAEQSPTTTIILLDQPTIVKNATGQRPVESIVGSPVSLRYGGIQPANTARDEMFGDGAPVWTFLTRFGGPADPLGKVIETRVFETYPVLTLIALGWTLSDSRVAGRLPKYNPERKKTFLVSDWRYVCDLASTTFRDRGLSEISRWIDDVACKAAPRKSDQDGLDACLCLAVGLYLVERQECLMVGNCHTGYIIVPFGAQLRSELDARCNQTGRVPSEWVRAFRLQANAP